VLCYAFFLVLWLAPWLTIALEHAGEQLHKVMPMHLFLVPVRRGWKVINFSL
jgi:hypothetical protein